MFSLHQTSSILVLHIHNNSESLLDHFVKDLTERLQQKSQLQDRSFCFSNSNKQHQNHNRLNNKHLDGGLKVISSSSLLRKQNAHTQIIQLSCSSQSQTSFSLSIISLKNLFVAHNNVMWINDGSLAKQSYARAFAWSNESTFQKRGYIQYIYILRCSFHETAKRLSITSLTHLLRLRSKIQSNICLLYTSPSPRD